MAKQTVINKAENQVIVYTKDEFQYWRMEVAVFEQNAKLPIGKPDTEAIIIARHRQDAQELLIGINQIKVA